MENKRKTKARWAEKVPEKQPEPVLGKASWRR